MKPGLYGEIPEDQYHGGDGVSVSRLKLLAEPGGPAKVKYGYRKESPSLRFGTLIHSAILEPHHIERRFHVVDLARLDGRTKAYQAEEEKACGREIVKRGDLDEALRIRDAVMRHPIARELLDGHNAVATEVSAYWIDEATGLLCRGRVDAMRRDMRILIDLKSCAGADREEFGKSVNNYRYHWQTAFYEDGVSAAPGGFPPEAFVFLAVEKEPPYLVGAYEVEPGDVDLGRDEVRIQLERYAECVRTDHWPGLSETLETVSLPPWARRAA